MLELKDLFHLPELDAIIGQLADDESGLIVVAGLDTPAASAGASTDADGFLPSGRAAIFRILIRHLLTLKLSAHAIVVAEAKDTLRVSRQLKHQVEWLPVEPPHTYASRITYATFRRPELLVIDHLDLETAPLALQAAQRGIKVLSQLDTVFSGAGVARHLLEWGIPREALDALTWIITVQRVATLCPHCKEPVPVTEVLLDELRHRYPAVPLGVSFFRPTGLCHMSSDWTTGQRGGFRCLSSGRACPASESNQSPAAAGIPLAIGRTRPCVVG